MLLVSFMANIGDNQLTDHQVFDNAMNCKKKKKESKHLDDAMNCFIYQELFGLQVYWNYWSKQP